MASSLWVVVTSSLVWNFEHVKTENSDIELIKEYLFLARISLTVVSSVHEWLKMAKMLGFAVPNEKTKRIRRRTKLFIYARHTHSTERRFSLFACRNYFLLFFHRKRAEIWKVSRSELNNLEIISNGWISALKLSVSFGEKISWEPGEFNPTTCLSHVTHFCFHSPKRFIVVQPFIMIKS